MYACMCPCPCPGLMSHLTVPVLNGHWKNIGHHKPLSQPPVQWSTKYASTNMHKASKMRGVSLFLSAATKQTVAMRKKPLANMWNSYTKNVVESQEYFSYRITALSCICITWVSNTQVMHHGVNYLIVN